MTCEDAVMASMQQHITIVGGGAGGAELAVRLGRTLGPKNVLLVDQSSLHVWKPSLHEVAAGTLDIHREGLSYFMLARERGFSFVQGQMRGLDRVRKTLALAPLHDAQGNPVLPARELPYDKLVLALGSRSNFFATPGVAQYALTIDSTAQAETFRLRLLAALIQRTHNQDSSAPLTVVIVGGGATGVEFAAELADALHEFTAYGLQNLNPRRDVRIVLLEGTPRLLPPLPERVAQAALALLQRRGVNVQTSVRVVAMDAHALQDNDGQHHPYDLCLWAAGIRAPKPLDGLDLPANKIGQIITDHHLRTADPDIWALGDCAATPGADGQPLPARAQVAHQQAKYLYRVLSRRAANGAPFNYRDRGSLVALGEHRAAGYLVGTLSGKTFFMQGLLTRWMYAALHLSHYATLLGVPRTALIAVGRLFLRRTLPRVKLH